MKRRYLAPRSKVIGQNASLICTCVHNTFLRKHTWRPQNRLVWQRRSTDGAAIKRQFFQQRPCAAQNELFPTPKVKPST